MTHCRLRRGPAQPRVLPRFLERESPKRGRPPEEFRLVFRVPGEVEEARGLGLPVFLLTPELTTMLGCSSSFPPLLLVGATIAEATTCPWRRIAVLREASLKQPELEALAGGLLRFNPLLARTLLLRNVRSVDPVRLLRVVMTEGLERPATLVRLQEFSPSIPSTGAALPTESLAKQERNDRVEGLLA